MTVTVILTLLVAKLRGYHLKPMLKAYWCYPVFLYEAFGIFLQVQVFVGNYQFIAWHNTIKGFYMLLYLLPVLAYKLYIPAIVGSGFIFSGTLLNKLVMNVNDGKMPVYPSLSKITGYFHESTLGSVDSIHILGNADTKLKFLSDYIDVGYSILSVGDLLNRVFVVLVLFYTVKYLQPLHRIKEKYNDSTD